MSDKRVVKEVIAARESKRKRAIFNGVYNNIIIVIINV